MLRADDSPAAGGRYPADRDWQVPHTPLMRYPHLHAAWHRSRATCASIRRLLEQGPLPASIETVAVSGSLGRMEQVARSDLDLIVVLTDDTDPAGRGAEQAYVSVGEVLRPLGLPAPRPTGIYAATTTPRTLCDPASVGKVDDDISTFGKRIQLLLDAQPVFRAGAFEGLVARVLSWYGQGPSPSPKGHADYLLHDLTRYFHAVAVDCQGRQRNEPGTWRLRNLKRLHSRRIIHAGLLLLLGQRSIRTDDPATWLRSQLVFTPLERVGRVFAAHGDRSFEIVLNHYDTFLARMDDAAFRQGLEEPVCDVRALDEHTGFAELRENARRMTAELTRFVWSRRGDWSDAFFESLLF